MPFATRFEGFIGNVGAYVASEAAAKVSRLGVVAVIARTMDPAAIGLAAAAMAASDLLKSLTENGVVHRIIRAKPEELEAVCRTAYLIFWAWCGGLFVLQLALAGVLCIFFGEPLIGAMIALLAIEYLFMPGGLTQCALAMREGRLKSTAAISGAQIVGANLLTVVLALIWPSPLAIVLPKVISAPVWLIGMRRLRPWTLSAGPRAALSEFTRFGAAIIGVEIMKAIRLQADKLVIGGLLGAEALGAWFFAVNAGFGLATSLATAFSIVLFPHLCAAKDRDQAMSKALKTGLAIMVPLVLLQAAAAPIYVPIIFGEKWANITGLVSILCLTAIPGLVWSATAQWLRANDRAGVEFLLSAGLAVAGIGSIALLAPLGLEAVAWGLLATAAVLQLGACALMLLGNTPSPQEA